MPRVGGLECVAFFQGLRWSSTDYSPHYLFEVAWLWCCLRSVPPLLTQEWWCCTGLLAALTAVFPPDNSLPIMPAICTVRPSAEELRITVSSLSFRLQPLREANGPRKFSTDLKAGATESPLPQDWCSTPLGIYTGQLLTAASVALPVVRFFGWLTRSRQAALGLKAFFMPSAGPIDPTEDNQLVAWCSTPQAISTAPHM
jgi:hypothetical protein